MLSRVKTSRFVELDNMKMLKVLLFVSALVVPFVDGACDCGDKDVDIGPNDCEVHIHVCGCLEDADWKYEATATEEKSGISASAKWYDSSTGAGEWAVVYLFFLLNRDTCNCFEESLS